MDICSVRFSAGVLTASTTMGQCHSCRVASVAVTRPCNSDAAHAPSMPLCTSLAFSRPDSLAFSRPDTVC